MRASVGALAPNRKPPGADSVLKTKTAGEEKKDMGSEHADRFGRIARELVLASQSPDGAADPGKRDRVTELMRRALEVAYLLGKSDGVADDLRHLDLIEYPGCSVRSSSSPVPNDATREGTP